MNKTNSLDSVVFAFHFLQLFVVNYILILGQGVDKTIYDKTYFFSCANNYMRIICHRSPEVVKSGSGVIQRHLEKQTVHEP